MQIDCDNRHMLGWDNALGHGSVLNHLQGENRSISEGIVLQTSIRDSNHFPTFKSSVRLTLTELQSHFLQFRPIIVTIQLSKPLHVPASNFIRLIQFLNEPTLLFRTKLDYKRDNLIFIKFFIINSTGCQLRRFVPCSKLTNHCHIYIQLGDNLIICV